MADFVELPEVDIYAGDDEEERRRREEAAADPLASLGDDVSGAVGDVMSDAVQRRALDQMRAPPPEPMQTQVSGDRATRPMGRPSAEPQGYVEAARQVAPQEVGLGRPGERPPTALAAQAAPPRAPATASAAPIDQTPNPSLSRAGAATSSPGLASTRDKDLEAALAARDSRRTKTSIVDAIALLLGGGGDRVTQQIGQDPRANEALDDLRLRRESRAQAEQQRARQSETARTARTQAEEEARTRARRDPNSPESVSMQDAIGRMGIGVTAEQVRGISAEDLERNGVIGALVARRAQTTGTLENTNANIAGRATAQDDQQAFLLDRDAINNEVRERIAAMRGRRGGSGGGGGGGASSDEIRQAYVDTMVAHGMSEEDATTRARALSTRDLRATIRSESVAVAGTDVRNDSQRTRAAEQSEVPGWSRRADAPEISVAERSKLRDANSTMNELTPSLRRLAQIHAQVDAAQRAGARADVLSPLMARARIEHENVITALRNIGNYGVPQAAELARMESIAPRLESAAGFLSAGNIYPALEQALTGRLAERMRSYGYERGGAAGGGTTGRTRMRFPDGSVHWVSDANRAAVPQGTVPVDGS